MGTYVSRCKQQPRSSRRRIQVGMGACRSRQKATVLKNKIRQYIYEQTIDIPFLSSPFTCFYPSHLHTDNNNSTKHATPRAYLPEPAMKRDHADARHTARPRHSEDTNCRVHIGRFWDASEIATTRHHPWTIVFEETLLLDLETSVPSQPDPVDWQ